MTTTVMIGILGLLFLSLSCSSFEIPLLGEHTSSSSFINSEGHANHTSDKAVDGNTNGRYWDGSCATTSVGRDHWWMANLTRSYPVSCVVMYRRTDSSGEWFENTEVSVGNDPERNNNTVCGVVSLKQINQGQRIEMNCNDTLNGQYLVLKYGADAFAYFQVCEVQAFTTPCGVPTSTILPDTSSIVTATINSTMTMATTSSVIANSITKETASNDKFYISKVLFVVVILATIVVTALIVMFFTGIYIRCQKIKKHDTNRCTCGQQTNGVQPDAHIPLDNNGYVNSLNDNTRYRYEDLRQSNVLHAANSIHRMEPQSSSIETADEGHDYEQPESVSNDYASVM